jgi:predicted ATPase/class 3 adenylate cyclase
MARTETVTVLFTDLVRSTELASTLGHDSYEDLRDTHFRTLRSAALEHNGVEIKTTGDGLMLAFASAADAVACAIAMQQATGRQRYAGEKLQIRIGASSGEATRTDRDLYGPPVVEASRLCDVARPDQILVSDLVRGLSRGRKTCFSAAEDLALKGLPEPVAACTVAWEPRPWFPLPPKIPSVSQLGLFGRAAEQSVIATRWEAARKGRLQVVLIAGEPGIGKTRLAIEAARTAHAQEAIVLFGSCDEDVNRGYRPFVEALRHLVVHAPREMLRAHVGEHKGELARLLPDLADLIPDLPSPQAAESETERYMMFEAGAGIIRSACRMLPTLLILDDMQWAGAQNLSLLKHVVRSLASAPLLILGTYRDVELTRSHPLTSCLADLRREAEVERISLRGIDEEAVAALMSAAAGHELDALGLELARTIRKETDGSPMFVGEILRNLTESGKLFRDGERWTYRGGVATLEIPEGVRQAIGRRLSRLSERTNRVLSLASVIGREFDLGVLGRIAGLNDDVVLDALDEAMSAALIHEVRGETDLYAFRHELIRTTLYEELTASRRARIHRRIGEALEELAEKGPDGRVTELAHHWLSATKVSDSAKALTYVRAAGDRAMAALAFEAAAICYEQALAVLDPQSPDVAQLRCDLLIALGDAQRRAGAPGYRETMAKATAIAREIKDPRRLALAALGAHRPGGMYASATHADEELIALDEESVAALGDLDSPLRAELLSRLSVELVFTPQRQRRHDLSEQAVAIARRVGDKSALAKALNNRIFAIHDPTTLMERRALSAELDGVVNDLGSLELAWQAAYHRAGVLLELGDLPGSEQSIGEIENLSRMLRQPFFAWWASVSKAMLATFRAEPDAERLIKESFQVASASAQPDAGSVFGAQLSEVRRIQGRYGELIDVIRANVEAQPHIPAWRASLCWLYCETDRPDEAREQLAPLAADGFAIPQHWTWSASMLILAEVCADLRDAAAAAQLYPRLNALSGQVGTIVNLMLCYGALAYPCGLFAAALENWDDAERHFRLALATNDRIGARAFAVRTRRGFARMLLDRGRADDSAHAGRLIKEAEELAAEIGMARELVRLGRLRERLQRTARWSLRSEPDGRRA